LHGDKVKAYEVREIIIGRRCTQPETALLLMDNSREVPFPDCPPPDYITGFRGFRIKFLDNQVLKFFEIICSRVFTNKVSIQFDTKMKRLDKKQCALVNQLLQKFSVKELPNIHRITISLDNCPYLQDVDNKTRLVYMFVNEVSDIPILMESLAAPRPDGQQRVLALSIDDYEGQQLVAKLLEAIKKEFRSSTRRMPQPFFICGFCHFDANINVRIEEENEFTGEKLLIDPVHDNNDNFVILDIYRHPKQQHDEWVKKAKERYANEFLHFGARRQTRVEIKLTDALSFDEI
jgi:hypothetical protein